MKIVGRIAILTLICSYTTIAFAGKTDAQRNDLESTTVQPTTAIEAVESGAPAQPPAAPTPQKATTDPNGGWHFSIVPYLWFAGMHGSVGAHGHEASVHADFGDIFSNLNIGLMAGAEARHKNSECPSIFYG